MERAGRGCSQGHRADPVAARTSGDVAASRRRASRVGSNAFSASGPRDHGARPQWRRLLRALRASRREQADLMVPPGRDSLATFRPRSRVSTMVPDFFCSLRTARSPCWRATRMRSRGPQTPARSRSDAPMCCELRRWLRCPRRDQRCSFSICRGSEPAPVRCGRVRLLERALPFGHGLRRRPSRWRSLGRAVLSCSSPSRYVPCDRRCSHHRPSVEHERAKRLGTCGASTIARERSQGGEEFRCRSGMSVNWPGTQQDSVAAVLGLMRQNTRLVQRSKISAK